MPQPLVWQRRQPPSQQATIGPAPVEGVERTNAVVVRRSGQGIGAPTRRDPYAMEVDQERNCYAYGEFRHMACYCRNRRSRRVVEGRRIKYGRGKIKGNIEQIGHLKEVDVTTQRP